MGALSPRRSRRSTSAWAVALTGALLLGPLLISLGGGILSHAAAPGETGGSRPGAVAGIPAGYLAAYELCATRFGLGPRGWSTLAGIGEVESDHGRSTAPGVLSGQNTNGCCAGPMQIHNGFGASGGTWGAYAVDGDGDGRRDIYAIADAACTAAHYLVASGAPDDWRRALFAYNHDETYVAHVLEIAAGYRAAAEDGGAQTSGEAVSGSGQWLARVPGFPGEECDARIVADVVALTTEFGLRLTDCFGGAPHDTNGEHPLGLATDLVPVDGDWNRTLRLAESFGWSPTCASSGCPGRGPFRVILYNGYPGHGDPAHAASPHLHLSWQHASAAPFTRAAWVRVLIVPAAGARP
jgi:hypothetical protein